MEGIASKFLKLLSYPLMNIAFSKIIRIAERQWEFNFRKRPGEQPHFHADTTDQKGNRIQFSMLKEEQGGWRVTGMQIPAWIAGAAEILGKAIEEGMAGLVGSH